MAYKFLHFPATIAWLNIYYFNRWKYEVSLESFGTFPKSSLHLQKVDVYVKLLNLRGMPNARLNLIAMIRQSIWFIKYFRKKYAADTHWTWFHSFFHSSASKKQKGYFFLFINPPFKRFFCLLQHFLVVSHFSLTGTKITCYIYLGESKQALKLAELWKRCTFP